MMIVLPDIYLVAEMDDQHIQVIVHTTEDLNVLLRILNDNHARSVSYAVGHRPHGLEWTRPFAGTQTYASTHTFLVPR